MSKLMRRIAQTAGTAALVAAGLIGVGQPASAAAHTCNGSEDIVSSTAGARVCFYGDTWTFKICDTASGNHPGARVFYSGSNHFYEDNPGLNHCGSERAVPLFVPLSFQAIQYNASGTALNKGPTIGVI